MSLSALPYIGGKTRLSDWIISQIPEHRIYVEPFGGGGSVLLNKPRSWMEVYNDTYGEVVNFFEVARDEPDELLEYLKWTPYSRSLYEEYQTAILEGDVPEDPVARAGQFYLVANASMQATTATMNGFKSSRSTARARTWDNKREDVAEVAERFKGVTIESRDYQYVVEKYDTEETFCYFDPPYVDVGDDYYSHDGEFDHGRLFETLDAMEGMWLLSYGEELPEVLAEEIEDRGWCHLNKLVTQDTNSTKNTEQLVANYDPRDAEEFRGHQRTIAQYEDD